MNRTASDEPLRAEAADRSIGPMGRYAWALVTAVAVAAAQAGKAAAFDYVSEHGVIDVTPFLTIRTGMNPGIAFGLAPQVKPFVLFAVAATISLALLIFICR